MAIFTVKDPGGRLVGLVRQSDNDESAVRELMAGKGKDRDERFIGHDGGFEVSAVEAEGGTKVLWRSDEVAPVAGAKPDNRETK